MLLNAHRRRGLTENRAAAQGAGRLRGRLHQRGQKHAHQPTHFHQHQGYALCVCVCGSAPFPRHSLTASIVLGPKKRNLITTSIVPGTTLNLISFPLGGKKGAFAPRLCCTAQLSGGPNHTHTHTHTHTHGRLCSFQNGQAGLPLRHAGRDQQAPDGQPAQHGGAEHHAAQAPNPARYLPKPTLLR